MTALGLLTGMVQAYIFFILAAVAYIAAATRRRKPKPETTSTPKLETTTNQYKGQQLWIA